MPSINKCIVLLTLTLSATAFGSSHVARSNHRGLARNARPDVLADVIPMQRRTRSNSKRCKAKPSSSSSSSSTSHKHSSTQKVTKATAPAPKDAPAYTPKPTSTSAKPKSTPDNGGGGSGSGNGGGGGDGGLTTGGIATFYTQNGNAGACGDTHSDSDIICALETATYANGAHCGKYVLITNTENGKTVKVLVADECPTCNNKQSIDLSTGAYRALGGTVSEGIFPIAWQFV